MLFLLNLSSCVVKGSMDGLSQQDLEGMTMPKLCRVYVAAWSDGQVSSETLKGHASPPLTPFFLSIWLSESPSQTASWKLDVCVFCLEIQ